ncbi:site-specific integrase [Natronorubrum texcoconense]|uniref:Uncharacterized protein n=1 Tax=Natronorubrum texcoconense TaxID=1095776 RepID=A0A1G8V298_9EURY|nr:hypothetical protein [Natronorubrum texcoconense]SDJ59280.1 hypothetical protein SAMN04515672_1105 [Natronorubrum texcoconense]
MTALKWTSEYVQRKFPDDVREVRRAEGENPDVKPTHKWLREHGLIGIQGYAERHDKTVDDVLLNECGFDSRKRKPLPGTHGETKQLVRKWLEDEDTAFSRLGDTSIKSAWSHMRKLMEISQDALGSSNLLRPARAPKGKNIRLTLDLFRAMNEELESEGSRYNYASTLKSFYGYLEMTGEVDSNPAEAVLPRMGWSYTRESPEIALKPAQVRKCWEATESVDEDTLEELGSAELRELLTQKILLLCLAGCGQRTSDPLITHAKEDIILDPADPRICFDEERKNGQGTTPIMAGLDYFEEYIGLLEEEGYEMLFPSEDSEDGTRSDGWVRNEVEKIVDRADIRLPDGSRPTPKHFRQFWYNEYFDAYEAYIAKVEDVAAAQSSASAEIVDKHYLASHRARDHFRRFANAHFETAFPTDVVISPEEIAEARNTGDEDDQSSLTDFVTRPKTDSNSTHAIVGAMAVLPIVRWNTELATSRAVREFAAMKHDEEVIDPTSVHGISQFLVGVVAISVMALVLITVGYPMWSIAVMLLAAWAFTTSSIDMAEPRPVAASS